MKFELFESSIYKKLNKLPTQEMANKARNEDHPTYCQKCGFAKVVTLRKGGIDC
jgi:predicted Zn-ribbon and HTH transcriptional regulator